MGDPIFMTGLQFFGAMTASISHEIKNRMAIINEQAGLLTDFVKMAENGRPLDGQRLERLAAAVRTQVSLADTIIKNMNQFAHSTDHFHRPVNMEELLDLTVALLKRKAENSGLHLEVHPPPTPVTVKTAPFMLMNLIWLCLLPIINEKQKNQLLTFTYEKSDDKFYLYLKLGEAEHPQELILPKTAIELAEILEATLTLNAEKNVLKIELPAKPLTQSAV